MRFSRIKPEEIKDNAIKLIGKDWMLIASGNELNNNCMTASWGGLGVLWNKPVAYIFVRPQRYTNEFLELEPYFTLNFFDEPYRDILSVCGKQSGRDINKALQCGLEVFETFNKSIAYTQSRLILECKKLFAQQLDPNCFIEKEHLHHYPNKDYHILYVGEITDCLIKK